MAKKHDLPAMPFYFGDWRKAPEIRALDLDVRMIWFEMLGYMWESSERGYLTINGNPPTHDILARMLGIDQAKFKQALEQMESMNVFSVRATDGAIFSRKMVYDHDISRKRAISGQKGGKTARSLSNIQEFAKAKEQANTENETENEIEFLTEENKGGLGEKSDTVSMYHPDRARHIIDDIQDLIRYLNSKTGGCLDTNHSAYCSAIWRRLQDGYSLDQLRAVIDVKVDEWLPEAKTRGWLVPTTLFSEAHFSKYLNQAILDSNAKKSETLVHNHQQDIP